MPICLGNQHQLCIAVFLQLELLHILNTHHQQNQVNIYMSLYDYQHDIELLEHNDMDLGNVHLHKLNGMGNLDLLCIQVFHMKLMDFRDNYLNSSIVHDDYNRIDKLHFFHIEFVRMAQHNFD